MIEHTKNIIETLAPMNACLLGEGYDNRLEFIKSLVTLDILEFPSGTELGTWTVPEEWVVRDAWVKDPEGNKIADYKTNPLSLVVGSKRKDAIIPLEELRKHWHYSDEMPNATPYVFNYYETAYHQNNWGFCFPKNQIRKESETPLAGVLREDGTEFIPKTEDVLKDGDYEVFIDTEYVPGKLKIGVHTIKGESDREILLLAHIDHPFQANDNVSGVACLLDIVSKIKSKHTIKIVFCPETIGSTAYALSQDVSKVDFVLAVDICGNKNSILFQKALDVEARINKITHLALHQQGESYRKGVFRNTIGSDESVFNDPLIGIPGIMLSTWPYPEYHTSDDTPDKIDYESIEKMGKVILTILDYWDKDFIPKREFRGQLMRSRYGIQTNNKQVNLSWDYFCYAIDGKKYLSELCADYGLNFEYTLKVINKLIKDGKISRVNPGEVKVKKTPGKKSKTV